MSRKSRAAFGACALAALLLTGCHKSNKIQLAFVTNNPSDYWTFCKYGVEKAQAQLPDAQVSFLEPADGSVATQISEVDDLLTKGVKGIAISPVNPANETRDLNQWASQTNLITSDSDAPNSNRLCYIGTDNVAAGVKVGDEMKLALPQGGNIEMFVGQADAQNAVDRINGVKEALKGSNVKVLGVLTDDTDHARAITNVSDTLIKHPHIAGLVGVWSYNGPAIVTALQKAGKIGKVKVVCFDQEQGTINGLQSGAIFASVVQQPYEFGYQSIMMLYQLAKGNKSGLPANKQIIIPTQIITPTTVNAYVATQSKLVEGGS